MNQKPSRRRPLRAVGDELDRAGADIADRARRLDRGRAHRRAQLGRHAGRRRFLDHLLMAALQRAVALVEMNDIAVPVAEHLHLDVARRGDVFLDQHARIAERRLRLALRALERRLEIGVLVDAAHALAAAAGDRLDQHRIADLVGLLLEKRRRPAARRDSPARPARRPSPSAPWRDPSAPWRASPSGGGPTKTMPAAAQASANSAFSERKP